MNNLPIQKTVLVCPLDWGLGHASRMIPVINKLLNNKNKVIIAADNLPYNLLKDEFPGLQFIRFPSYKIKYSGNKSQAIKILVQIPRIKLSIWKEHRQLKRIISKNKIEVVISDNRFGCWNKKVKSVYVTHQVMVKMPKGLKFLEFIGYLIHKWFINKYDECWIPDWEGVDNLSGDLSHKYKVPDNAGFVGPLSRFERVKIEKTEHKFDVVCILSGPEPQRTFFEEILITIFLQSNDNVLIVQGLPGKNVKPDKRNITFANHLPTSELASVIVNSKNIICRSGYSSIMDLVTLNKNAVLVPTPGQTEQEYLGKIMHHKRGFVCVKQEPSLLRKTVLAGKLTSLSL
ncbi:MAG: glycosyltransferase [Chlorobi bacterium]|nr:glycosyltransferase [Chlorobiota bacterium]